MKREFNTTGICIAEKHYMADVSNKMKQIIEFIDRSKYFTINRGRQYGKTTMLYLLEKALQDKYIVSSISFEGLDETNFSSPESFCQTFMELVKE